CRGVQFKILCRDPSPVTYFSIYFQSGEGWYHATYFPESVTGWNTIRINKAATQTEGKPAGWGSIKAIRISAWKGRAVNTEFYLSDLRRTGTIGADAVVAVLRGESAMKQIPEEARGVEKCTEALAENLDALDVGCAVLNDLEVTAQILQAAKLVILPYNPYVPERVTDELVQYLQHGGKLLAFYSVPERLRPWLGIKGGQHLKAVYPGNFAAIRFKDGSLPGAPAVVSQQSWNINAFRPAAETTSVLAEWVDDKGQPTGYPALLGSSNGIVMTHILLPDEAGKNRRMLMAMVGALVPEVWQKAAESHIAHIGMIGGFETYDQASGRIVQMSHQDTRVTNSLNSAAAFRRSALELATQQRFAEAIDQAEAARQKVKEAFCLAQSPKAGEFRAFWCHSAFGVAGISWDEAAGRLADNGFTAVFPNMLWGGVTFANSKVLPVESQVAARGDQVGQCLAACRKHGLQIHVWKVNWNLGAAAPKQFVDMLRLERRLQKSSGGKEEPWLCPSHPRNQALEIDSMVEIVRNYDVDGIHFDYIRYPDSDHCFCGGCKKRFAHATGFKPLHWPQDVLGEGAFRQQWLEWRRSNITAVVKAVSARARAIRPRIKLSAAVFSNWASDRDGVGQDWKLWCDQGYLDFVCPMDYTPSSAGFENMVVKQVQWAGRVPCYPGIGVSASSSSFGVDRVIEQINITRRHNTGGFIIFNYGVTESRELLPLLGLGITAK
ncbi:MAG: family 10 glycosylhydrolase, partial [Verrucomicrobia bacterium]|nr:family 10 glycosylhydrolase [Verrucomicrobiota bacterium]